MIEIIMIGVEINKIEIWKITESVKPKIGSLINKTEKALARLTKKKKEKTQVTKMRNARGTLLPTLWK